MMMMTMTMMVMMLLFLWFLLLLFLSSLQAQLVMFDEQNTLEFMGFYQEGYDATKVLI